MKLTIRAAMVLIALVLPLVANAGAAKRNAVLFEQAAQHDLAMAQEEGKTRKAEAQAKAQTDIAAINLCGQAKDPTMCVLAIKMASAMEAMAGGAQGPRQALQVPYERDMAAKFRDFMTPIMPIMGQAVSGMERIKLAESAERVQVQQYSTFAGISQAAIQANTQVSGAAIANAQPSYNVSGVLVQGDQHVGDSITGDGNATHGAQNGDNITGEVIASRGSQIGDDIDVSGSDNAIDGVIDNTITDVSGAYLSGSSGNAVEQGAGDQRIGSPGPIDNSDNGDCDGEGDSCNEGGG